MYFNAVVKGKRVNFASFPAPAIRVGSSRNPIGVHTGNRKKKRNEAKKAFRELLVRTYREHSKF
jgi:hypothetical protein